MWGGDTEVICRVRGGAVDLHRDAVASPRVWSDLQVAASCLRLMQNSINDIKSNSRKNYKFENVLKLQNFFFFFKCNTLLDSCTKQMFSPFFYLFTLLSFHFFPIPFSSLLFCLSLLSPLFPFHWFPITLLFFHCLSSSILTPLNYPISFHFYPFSPFFSSFINLLATFSPHLYYCSALFLPSCILSSPLIIFPSSTSVFSLLT